MEAQVLRTKGWSITAIANHLGHDRKTIRAYLNGERRPGERAPARPEAMAEFLDYCRVRLTDDPHLWSTTLFDEVVGLGFGGSYQAFTAAIRRHELRPRCAACAANRHKDRSVIDHPAGEETQWDWLELPDAPEHWGFGDTAHLLLGMLPHSSRWRGWIAECEDQPHLIEGLHQVATRLGGLSQRWWFDRMATVCHVHEQSSRDGLTTGRNPRPLGCLKALTRVGQLLQHRLIIPSPLDLRVQILDLITKFASVADFCRSKIAAQYDHCARTI